MPGDETPSAPRRPDGDTTEPAARARGRPVGDREAKRAELLGAAIAVIAREGFAGASLRKVAQQAGYTTGAVTYYFANKEAMVKAVVESLFDSVDDLLTSSDEPVDVRAILERWFEWTSAEDPDPWLANFQLLVLARNDVSLAAVFARRYAQYRDTQAAMLARGQRQGVIRADIAPELLCDQLVAMADGWMMMFPIEPDRFRPDRLQALLDATITLVSPPRPAG